MSYQGKIKNTLPLRATKPHGHQLTVYQSTVTAKLETTWAQFRLLTSLLICFTTEAGSRSIGIVGPLLFVRYIIDLLLKINSISAPNLFAGDTGVIIQAEISKISVQCQI